MRSGISDGEGSFDEVVDVTMYDGPYRRALTWLRDRLPAKENSVLEPLRRFLADHDPPIRIE